MPIAAATLADLSPVRHLLQTATYCYVDIGAEDVAVLLAQAHSTLGQENGKLWGVLGVQQEERPVTLPAAAPTRAYLRVLAVQRPMRPGPSLQALLAPVQEQFAGSAPGVQLICYGAEPWVHQTLTENGFAEVEQVQFFELDRLSQRAAALPPGPAQLQITPGRPDYLAELARLDAAAFSPLWHFGPKDLLEMLMRCRVQLAWWDGVLAGYTAVCANSRSEAQLARLAVHPDYQGRGVGRALLGDTILYAAQEFHRLVLNTQTTNQRSQKLYLGFGFRPIGLSVPVLVRLLQ
jgi:ribosomal protein S18 acetylase RimI-like enzyme